MPYATIAQAKSAGFPTKAEGIAMTIAQINKLAAIYDAVKKNKAIKIPFAVAWAQWKKLYKKIKDSWIKKEATEKLYNQKIFSSVRIEDLQFAENTTEIQVLVFGLWKHPEYGRIRVKEKEIAEFISNFDNKIRKDLPITEGHSVGNQELPAIGWFRELVNKGRDGLWAVVEWTKEGKKLLEEKAYKYFSPEFYSAYEDPETHKIYANVLVGGALTNRPYFKGLQAVTLSEFTFDEGKMELKDIVTKEATELTDEEKDFLKEKKDELTDEQKETYKDVLTEGEGEGEENKEENKEGEEKKEEKKEEGEENKEEGKEEKVEGSEKVMIDSKTLKMLEGNAQEGVTAMSELRRQKAEGYVKELVFSESNKTGPVLPKSRDKVVKFLLSLSEKQQAAFKEIMAEMPKSVMFSELGKDSGVAVKSSEQAQELAKAKMEKDEKLTYRQAIDQVFAENPELSEQVESERE